MLKTLLVAAALALVVALYLFRDRVAAAATWAAVSSLLLVVVAIVVFTLLYFYRSATAPTEVPLGPVRRLDVDSSIEEVLVYTSDETAAGAFHVTFSFKFDGGQGVVLYAKKVNDVILDARADSSGALQVSVGGGALKGPPAELYHWKRVDIELNEHTGVASLHVNGIFSDSSVVSLSPGKFKTASYYAGALAGSSAFTGAIGDVAAGQIADTARRT